MRPVFRPGTELDALLRKKTAPLAAGLSAGETHRTLALLVVVPCLVFSAMILLFTQLYHPIPYVLCGFLGLCLALCIRQSVVNYLRGSPDGAYAMGLCVVAMLAGIAVGYRNYSAHMEPYWAFEEGRQYKDVRAEELADAHRDASSITFVDGVRPDVQASIGYRAGPAVYCAAPVGAWDAGAASRETQFWAVGKDCCKDQGSFACDDAKSASAHGGLVISHSDDVEKYIHAVRTAEAQNGARSALDPIFVKWVVNFDAARDTFLNEAWLFWFLASLAYLPLSAALVVLAPSSLKSIDLVTTSKQGEI